MLYKFETHAHTSESSSCGRLPAEVLVESYIARGFTGAVITDHFSVDNLERFAREDETWESVVDRYLSGYRAARAVAGSRFTVLLGAELRFIDTDNDFLLFGIDEDFLLGAHPLINMTQDEFGAVKSGQGDFLFFQAHPFRRMCSPAAPEHLDGVEVFNGNFRHNSHNDEALAFAEKNGLLMSGGSDFHKMSDLAHGGITTDFPITSNEELVKALRGEHGIITAEYVPE